MLAECYRNALRLAEDAGLTSLGFPALSTGAFGYPMDEAAAVALATVVAEGARLERVKRVRFVLLTRPLARTGAPWRPPPVLEKPPR